MRAEGSTADVANVSRAYRRRIAQIGLAHLGGVDARTAVILKRNGILQHDDAGDDTESRGMVEVVADPSHRERLPLPSGPLVARATGENHRTVIPVVILLFAESVDVRRVALAHFERPLPGPPWLTPRTLLMLVKHREALLRAEFDQWQPAAVRIHDAVKNDWLCNVRGLAQSTDLRFEEGLQEYFPAVLRPSTSSLDSIEMAVWSPATERSKVDAIIADCVYSVSTLGEAMETYYSKLGHLPLAGTAGMGEVVRQWLQSNKGAVSLWTEIWKWADRHPSPLPRYHACAALAENPSLITPESWPALGAEIAAVIGESDSDETKDTELPWKQAWRVRCELALHYCQHLEVRLPGAESERIAAISWWLAEKVALVIGRLEEDLRNFRERTLRYEMALSERIWHLARARLQSSSLRCATIASRSIWGLSLLCELRHSLTAFCPDRLDSSVKARLERALRERLMAAFPITPVVDDSGAYGFDATIIPSVEAWIQAAAESESRNQLSVFLAPIERVAQADQLRDALDRLPGLGLADQMFVGHVLGIAARLGQAPEDHLWERLHDHQWHAGMLLRADDRPLELLFNALREIQLLSEDKWAWGLPHIYASACEEAESGDRRELLFAMVILSSVDAGTISAVERLLKGTLRGQLASHARAWRERFAEIWNLAPPLATARWRPMMVALSAASFADHDITQEPDKA